MWFSFCQSIGSSWTGRDRAESQWTSTNYQIIMMICVDTNICSSSSWPVLYNWPPTKGLFLQPSLRDHHDDELFSNIYTGCIFNNFPPLITHVLSCLQLLFLCVPTICKLLAFNLSLFVICRDLSCGVGSYLMWFLICHPETKQPSIFYADCIFKTHISLIACPYCHLQGPHI